MRPDDCAGAHPERKRHTPLLLVRSGSRRRRFVAGPPIFRRVRRSASLALAALCRPVRPDEDLLPGQRPVGRRAAGAQSFKLGQFLRIWVLYLDAFVEVGG